MAVECGEPAGPLFRDAVGGGEECADNGSAVSVACDPVDAQSRKPHSTQAPSATPKA